MSSTVQYSAPREGNSATVTRSPIRSSWARRRSSTWLAPWPAITNSTSRAESRTRRAASRKTDKPRALVDRPAGPDHRHLIPIRVSPIGSVRRARSPAGSPLTRSAGTPSPSISPSARSGPVATRWRHHRRLRRSPALNGPKVGDRLDVRQPGRFGQAQRRVAHLVVDDMDQVGPIQTLIVPERPRGQALQPATAQGRDLENAWVAGSTFPLETQSTWRRQPRRSSRSSQGASGQRASYRLSRPARIKILSTPAAMDSRLAAGRR